MLSKVEDLLRKSMVVFLVLWMIYIPKIIKDDSVQLIVLSSILTIDTVLIYRKNSSDKKLGKPLRIGQPFMFWMIMVLAIIAWGIVVYYSVNNYQ